MRELFTAPEAEVIIFVEDIVTQSDTGLDMAGDSDEQ